MSRGLIGDREIVATDFATQLVRGVAITEMKRQW